MSKPLCETFEEFWAQIRGSQMHAGQPRNSDTVAGVNLARQALKLATDAEDEELLLDAWAMMAYTLNANEEWNDAAPYYERAIRKYEARGDSLRGTRLHIGYVVALTHLGRYDEALKTAETAEAAFKAIGDEFRIARLYTNIANVYHRLDQHQRSYEYLVTAVRVFESLSDREAAANVYHGLGNALARIDRFDESEEMFDHSRRMTLDLGLK